MKTITQLNQIVAGRVAELMGKEDPLVLGMVGEDIAQFTKVDVNELSKNYESWATMVVEMNTSSKVMSYVLTEEEFNEALIVMNDEPSMREYYNEYVVPELNGDLNAQLAEMAKVIAS